MSKLIPSISTSQFSASSYHSTCINLNQNNPLARIFKVIHARDMRTEIFSFFSMREVVCLSSVSKFFKDHSRPDLFEQIKNKLKTKKLNINDLEDFPPVFKEAFATFPGFFKELTFLDASCSHLSDKMLHQEQFTTILSFCPNLDSMNFAKQKTLTDDLLISILKQYPDFTSLNLQDCTSLTNKSAHALAKCKKLVYLNLNGCYWLNKNAFTTIAKECIKLKQVSLAGCHSIDDNAVMALANSCPQLLNVDISRCSAITRSSLLRLADRCPRLDNIRLSLCSRASASSFIYLVSKCRQLTTIDLSGCEWVTDEVVKEISENCKDLTYITLQNCNLLTDAGIIHLAQCIHLKIIALSNCKKITDKALTPLFSQCRELAHIGLNNLPAITDAPLVYLALRSKAIKKIGLAYSNKVTRISRFALTICSTLDGIIGYMPEFQKLRNELSYQASTPPGRKYTEILEKIALQIKRRQSAQDPDGMLSKSFIKIEAETTRLQNKLGKLSPANKLRLYKIIHRLADGPQTAGLKEWDNAHNNTPLLADALHILRHNRLYIATSTS